jgi:hypothetical protein
MWRARVCLCVCGDTDHGPFNSWDRQVWEWMDDSSGVPTKSIIKKYDEIKGNFFVSALAS